MSFRTLVLSAGLSLSLVGAVKPSFAQEPPPAEPPPPPSEPPPSAEAPSPPPSAPPISPAIVIAPPPPGADRPQEAAPQAPRKPVRRPFEGSSLFNQNSMTTGTIFRGQQLYDDPTVESSLFILPRYALSDAWQLRGRVVVSYEYTNSDTTNYQNEPLLSDTVLSLYYRSIPEVLGFQPFVGGTLGVPTSKVSRARTMVVSPGLTAQLSRTFEHFLGGDALVLANVGYSHPIYRSANPETVDPRPPGAFACVGGTNCQDLLSGTMNPSDILSYTLILDAEWGKWSPAIMYLGASQWAYHPPAATNPVDGTPIASPSGFSPTNVRQTHYFSVWLDYNFNSWVTGEVGFWNSVQALNNDGQRSNILFDRYQDTRVYLGCSIQLDNLARTISGDSSGEGGVVRAKNQHSPMWTF
jgi:hypothetical protein